MHKKEHKVYPQTKRSEFFTGDYNLLSLTNYQKQLFCFGPVQFFFTKPDKSNVKPFIFVGQLCLILRATQTWRIRFYPGKFEKIRAGEFPSQKILKLTQSLGPGL